MKNFFTKFSAILTDFFSSMAKARTASALVRMGRHEEARQVMIK